MRNKRFYRDKEDEWTFDFENMIYGADNWVCPHNFKIEDGWACSPNGVLNKIEGGLLAVSIYIPCKWVKFNGGDRAFSDEIVQAYEEYVDGLMEELLTTENKSS